MKNQHVFANCTVCSKWNPLNPKDSQASLHANCSTLRHNPNECFVYKTFFSPPPLTKEAALTDVNMEPAIKELQATQTMLLEKIKQEQKLQNNAYQIYMQHKQKAQTYTEKYAKINRELFIRQNPPTIKPTKPSKSDPTNQAIQKIKSAIAHLPAATQATIIANLKKKQ